MITIIFEKVDFSVVFTEKLRKKLRKRFFEWVDENGEGHCTVVIWFKPLADDAAHSISKKFQLYKGGYRANGLGLTKKVCSPTVCSMFCFIYS